MRQRTMRAASMAQVADMANLSAAWQAVRRKHGSEGLDGVSIRDFHATVETHLGQMQQALCTHTYQPGALKRITLPKSGHRQRLIGCPYRGRSHRPARHPERAGAPLRAWLLSV